MTHPVGPLLPPPIRHPITGRRLIGGWLCQTRREETPLLSTDPAYVRKSAYQRLATHLHTAHLAGWTAAVLRIITPRQHRLLFTARRCQVLKASVPETAFILDTGRHKRLPPGWQHAILTARLWRPVAALCVGTPPPALAALTTIWRVASVLPPPQARGSAETLFALTTPDASALLDPRLHGWLVPAQSPDSPDLPRWKQVLQARPEIPVLFTVRPSTPWQALGFTRTRALLVEALGTQG